MLRLCNNSLQSIHAECFFKGSHSFDIVSITLGLVTRKKEVSPMILHRWYNLIGYLLCAKFQLLFRPGPLQMYSFRSRGVGQSGGECVARYACWKLRATTWGLWVARSGFTRYWCLAGSTLWSIIVHRTNLCLLGPRAGPLDAVCWNTCWAPSRPKSESWLEWRATQHPLIPWTVLECCWLYSDPWPAKYSWNEPCASRTWFWTS